MSVTVGESVLAQYRRFTLYNSPYVAHDEGCAIDLYPEPGTAPSPVRGEVVETKAVRSPPQDYAEPEDYLILVDTGSHIARVLHVEPSVEAGEYIDRGDNLGRLVRAGFFAPWVPNHIHLGFRPLDANPYRASGSLPVDLDCQIEPLGWDGTGTVVDTGETWARLDKPAHPAPGEYFVGLGSAGGILDGGLPHYDRGGVLQGGTEAVLAGATVGEVAGRTVQWRDCTVVANGKPVTGIALHCAKDRFGIKLVDQDMGLSTGDAVSVEIEFGD